MLEWCAFLNVLTVEDDAVDPVIACDAVCDMDARSILRVSSLVHCSWLRTKINDGWDASGLCDVFREHWRVTFNKKVQLIMIRDDDWVVLFLMPYVGESRGKVNGIDVLIVKRRTLNRVGPIVTEFPCLVYIAYDEYSRGCSVMWRRPNLLMRMWLSWYYDPISR